MKTYRDEETLADKRIEKIKRKYGENAFKRWGAAGGSPILRAWAKGKVKILKNGKKR